MCTLMTTGFRTRHRSNARKHSSTAGAGGAGSGGSYGHNSTCKKGFAPDGHNGRRGSNGDRGEPGEPGSVKVVTTVGAADLDLIRAALAQNPSLTLEAASSPSKSTRKRR